MSSRSDVTAVTLCAPSPIPRDAVKLVGIGLALGYASAIALSLQLRAFLYGCSCRPRHACLRNGDPRCGRVVCRFGNY